MVLDQEIEGNYEEGCISNDKDFEVVDVVNQYIQQRVDDDIGEGVKRSNLGSGFDVEVEVNNEDSVQEVGLYVLGEIEQYSNIYRSLYRVIFYEMEWYKWVRSFEFLEDESWDIVNINDKWGNDVCFFLGVGVVIGDVEGNED